MILKSGLNYFSGDWNFQRTISGQGEVKGTAAFILLNGQKDVLHYQEEGVFLLNQGSQYNISREYIYCYQHNQISVYFSDRRFFHTLKFINPLTATALHHCGQDRYEVLYEFYSPEQFCITYHVFGPAKHYTSKTVFIR